MDTLIQNKWSSVGILFGAVALMVGLLHVSLGPFTAPTLTLERAVARDVASVKRGIIAGLTGHENPVPAEPKPVNVDKVLDNVGIGLAVVALVCAFIGGMRHETRWGVKGAFIFGGASLVFYLLLFSLSIISGILIVMAFISWLTSGGG